MQKVTLGRVCAQVNEKKGVGVDVVVVVDVVAIGEKGAL